MSLKPSDIILNFILLICGLICIVSSQFMGIWGFAFILIGASTAALSLYDFSMQIFRSDKVRKLKDDKSGVAWIWAVAGLAILFCPFVYWAIGYPYDMIVTHLTGMYTLTGTMALAWAASRVIISYILAFVLFFIMVWAWVNSRNN
jgi:hypothetical protein